MTLAAARVGLRKLRTELRATADEGGGGGGGIGIGDGGSAQDLSLVILSSATVAALHLGELLLPVRVRETERESEREADDAPPLLQLPVVIILFSTRQIQGPQHL